MKYSHIWRLCLAVACLLLMAGCLSNSDATPTATSVPTPPAALSPTVPSAGDVSVFADLSLQDALDDMQSTVQSIGIGRARYTYDISEALAPQLTGPIKPDVFLSGDEKAMQSAIQSGAVVSGTVRELVSSAVVAVAPPPPSKNQPAIKVKTLADLGLPGVKIAVVDESQPAGALTLQIIDKLAADPAYGPDFKAKVLANIAAKVSDTVEVLSRVQQAHVDAGFALINEAKATVKPIMDANGTPRFLPVHNLNIPENAGAALRYYIAPVKGGANPEGAKVYIDFLLSEQGQGTLEGYGLTPSAANKAP